MAVITLQVQSVLKSGRTVSISIDDSNTVAQLIALVAAAEGVDDNILSLNFRGVLLENSQVLSTLGVVDGSRISTSNVISQLATKELRQVAKLDLATLTRTLDGNPRNVYNISLLPSRYVGNTSVPNPNPGGLVLGRPWTASTLPVGLVTENNQQLITEDDFDIILE